MTLGPQIQLETSDLQQSARFYETILSTISDFAYLFDLDGRFRFVNKPLLDLWGLTLEQATGKNFFELNYPEPLANKLQAQIQQVIATRKRVVDETEYTSPSGATGYFEYIFQPVLSAEGVVEAVAGSTRDISARKLAEERARTILESITDAFFAVDREWRFTYVNSQAERLLGRTPGDLVGQNLWEAYPGLRGSVFEPVYEKAMTDGIAQSITAFYPDHDRWYEVHSFPSPDGISIYFRNVTDKKHAEATVQEIGEKLDRHSRLFEQIASTTPDFIYVFDLQGRFLYANRRLLEVWGTTDEQAVGKSMLELGYPEWHAEMHLREIRQVIETMQPVKGEVPFTGGSGISGVYEYIFTPVLGSDGQVEVIAGTTRDVTERRKTESERDQLLESERAARSETERAGRIKDEFLATLSHELRTPLNAILGWSQILRTGNASEKDLQDGLATIERNARSQTQIIEDLLDMSRIISGKVRLDVQQIELADVVSAAIETVKPAATTKGIRLVSVLDPLKHLVSGDPNRLQQVFWNLLSNAVKFTPKGGRVQVCLERVNSHVEVSVTDTGEGIGAEFLPFVFDRFRQADATTTRRHGGLGLGLSIVKQLAELHGGSVSVKSPGAGQGTTFTVVLPLTVIHPQPEAAPARRHPEKPAAKATSDCFADVTGVKVLVVDDEPDARLLVKRLLEDCQAIVTVATGVSEAIERLQGGTFDVLVSDIGMPGADGYTLIKQIRALPQERGGEIPAIALTAYARSEDRVKSLVAGFQMHLTKPVEPAELIAVVSSLAGRGH